ncbi:MAG TPA: hypothetical protein VFT59_04415 [Candidatus Saccharimonadales bacterium]|nr:hypothetical protein [Candidatus Saccharimonadales bacterium]
MIFYILEPGIGRNMTNMPEPQVGQYIGRFVVLQYRGASDRVGQPVDMQQGWGSLSVLRANQLEVTRRQPHSPTSMSTHFETEDLCSFSFAAAEQPRMFSPEDWWRSAATERLTEQLNCMQVLPTINSPFMVGPIRRAGRSGTWTDAHVLICQTWELEQYLPAILTHMGVDPQDIEAVGNHLQTMIAQGEQERY